MIGAAATVLTLALSSLAAASPTYANFFPRQAVQQQSSFNALSNELLAVYYGKAQNTANPSLYDLCSDSDVDLVVMGFVRQLNGPTRQPTFDLTTSCKTPTKGNATVSCPSLAANITYCQSVGKKVLMSLGGSSSNLTLNTSSDAQQAANILWNVFGAGTATPSLRPFGNVTLDGFDFGTFLPSMREYSNNQLTSRQISRQAPSPHTPMF